MDGKVVIALVLSLAASCVPVFPEYISSCEYAEYFDVRDSCVYVISPYDGSVDTLCLSDPLEHMICMSSSHIACLSEIGADSLICAVSGLKYISNQRLHERKCPDIGYEHSLDYETVMSVRPDIVLTYTVSGTEPQYISKLKSLGIPVLVLYDHLERHPLARAEYIRLFGALAGRQVQADSVFAGVRDRYLELADSVERMAPEPKAVLMNIPYGDAWYVPGEDSYMAQLVRHAGGRILGAGNGNSSSVISLEDAYLLSQRADIWLNPGDCDSRMELSSRHHLFPLFGPLESGLPIYNNTLRSTPGGGNDFWESGSVRPDLVLEDLINIFTGRGRDMEYFLLLE